MREIVLTDHIQYPICIQFDGILYPPSEAAIYNGEPFGRKKLNLSVHYKTCRQIEEGFGIQDLHYYQWTRQKLERLGGKYERYLFSQGKGCGIDPHLYQGIVSIKDIHEKRTILAELATKKFIELYHSLKKRWDPSLTTKEILFFKLLKNRFTIIEGIHRITILYYTYHTKGYDSFVTDKKNIQKGFYYNRMKRYIKKVILGDILRCSELHEHGGSRFV
jgi:hypothetical protein